VPARDIRAHSVPIREYAGAWDVALRLGMGIAARSGEPMPRAAQTPRATRERSGTPLHLDRLAANALRDTADGVGIIDGEGLVVWANAALEAAVGAPSLAGARFGELFDAVPPAETQDMVARVMAGETWRGSFVRRGADADAGVWDATCSRLAADAQTPAHLVAVLRDVSERHAVEQRRVDFLSMVTHDIKGPLTVILGYAELLSDPDEQPSPAVVLDILGRIRESGEQIHALVSNFVELSRIEAGRLQLEFLPMDLTRLVGDVVARHEPRATRKGITVCHELVPLPELAGDRPHLERAIVNLLGNAIKFTPAGGRITVSTRVEGTCAAVVVADTGPGIPPEDLDDIFEKYRRASAAGRVEGTGLGLFIARTVVQAHAGDIRVETVVGQGSTFTILLPLNG
jgi:signal transduction histidine kinase